MFKEIEFAKNYKIDQQGNVVGLSEIMKQCTNKNFSYDTLLDIKGRKGFKHIVKDYNW